QRCFICGKSGATITCCKEDCGQSFHLPCAKEGGCVTQYITPYSTCHFAHPFSHQVLCCAHCPEQKVEATLKPGTKCPICMEPVEDRKTYSTMVRPLCKRAWFHKDCIQKQAIHSVFFGFCCPYCQNYYQFLMEVFIMGI
ncbi:G2E3 ligase, partial [Malurus elegans]|nr:G2E3 ligase [Malurus elegans]